MMKYIYTSAFLLLSILIYAQSANDKRGFKGKLTSTVTEIVDLESSDVLETIKEQTAIEFGQRTITIGSDAYDIVKREFDGAKTNTFTCTLRRGTYTITFIPKTSISVQEIDNDDIKTVYKI